VYKILKDAASDFHDLDNLGDPDKDVAISFCHLLIKINTENNHICIRGFDNDPALLFQFFETFVT
jgi:hypothetical protein